MSDATHTAWIDVAAEGDVKAGFARRADAGHIPIVLCREGDKIHALDEMCPHENKTLHFGIVMQGTIICPHHQYQFELQSGRCRRRRRCGALTVYPVRLQDGRVLVEVPAHASGL